MSGLGGPRPDDVLERLGREKEAEVVTGVFTIPLARMGPLCRSIDLDPAMLVQALGMQGARASSQMLRAKGLVKVALWQGVEVADDLTHHLS